MNKQPYISPIMMPLEHESSPYLEAFNAHSHAYSDAILDGQCHEEALRRAIVAALPFIRAVEPPE